MKINENIQLNIGLENNTSTVEKIIDSLFETGLINQISNFKFQFSNLKAQISNLNIQFSNLKSQISNLEIQISNFNAQQIKYIHTITVFHYKTQYMHTYSNA